MKIIFSDFDGTLFVPNNPQVFEKNLLSIEKWRGAGNKFALATGRSLASLGRVFPAYSDYFDYILANNGASVFDSSHTKIFSQELSDDLVDNIIAASPDEFLSEAKTIFFTDGAENREKSSGVIKLRVWHKQPETAQSLEKVILSKFDDQVQAHTMRYMGGSTVSWIGPEYTAFVDVISISAGKENAINFVLNQEPIDQVFSIGDDVNDINMLARHNGYAITGSPEAVITAAGGHTTATVSDLIKKIF